MTGVCEAICIFRLLSRSAGDDGSLRQADNSVPGSLPVSLTELAPVHSMLVLAVQPSIAHRPILRALKLANRDGFEARGP